jgi:hypothetical protein
MILQKGSKGKLVINLQNFLKITPDGNFGPMTEVAVRNWQLKNNIKVTGVVDSVTWDSMGLASTDESERNNHQENIIINKDFLPKGEYMNGPTKKEWLFLHHTAGWNDPYKVIKSWGRDNRGAIATEFVLGGPSITNNDNKFDGEIVQAFPEGGYGWHLGTGNNEMHRNSVGIEVCNFGYIKDGKTYTGNVVNPNQIVELKQPFRKYKQWHKYSDNQLNALKNLILYIANRDNIDVRKGLPELIKTMGVDAFDFVNIKHVETNKGLWNHTNVRSDKFDMFPQQELIDMLLSL